MTLLKKLQDETASINLESSSSLPRRGFFASAAAGLVAATASDTASADDKFQQGRDWTGNHPGQALG